MGYGIYGEWTAEEFIAAIDNEGLGYFLFDYGGPEEFKYTPFYEEARVAYNAWRPFSRAYWEWEEKVWKEQQGAETENSPGTLGSEDHGD